ncbi:MAG TPA: class I SAM-dependent methyltransferase, partial [Polyangia bacterium]
MHLIHRTTCRVCQSSSLTKVIDLGEQHLQGSFLKPGRQVPPLRRVPTSLVRCNPELDEKAC